MDDIDLGLHELSNRLAQDKTPFADSLPKTNPFVTKMTESRYVKWMKTYLFYWTIAVFLFIFIIWASPEYVYVTTVGSQQQHSTRKFSWSRFTTVFVISYVVIVSLHVGAIYITR